MKGLLGVVVMLLMHVTTNALFVPNKYATNGGLSSRKGQWYLFWGYNRAYYNRSDLHLKGEHYDFTLHNARAEDMPEKFDPDVYFNPSQMTVPQFNFRIGYYFRPNTAIGLGWDHMKYRLITTQLVEIDGFIDPTYYNAPPEYTGEFNHEYILYTSQFMDFHHSDGFNFLRVSLEQRIPLWKSMNGKHAFVAQVGGSIGAIVPWTDFTLFGEHNRNKLHVAGYGFSGNSAFRFEFFKWFFIQGNCQVGWTNLGNIILENHLDSRAEQKISFVERSWSIGGYFPLEIKKRDRNSTAPAE